MGERHLTHFVRDDVCSAQQSENVDRKPRTVRSPRSILRRGIKSAMFDSGKTPPVRLAGKTARIAAAASLSGTL
jgi:hypothetical protein